jgi:Arc/MetJ-type ribon-helix-helix transcriptional regulator
MNVSIPESLEGFIASRVRHGGYPDADAFIADLLRSEAGVMESIARGEPLEIDRHFDRRLEALVNEASESGDYVEATGQDFDEMEGQALEMRDESKSS